MDKLGDMDLFVRVVKNNGLAAAGREVGLSPASMSARIKGLEDRYGVRLLIRSTRRITLTDEGRRFFEDCVRVLDAIDETESRLVSASQALSGQLRVTTTTDLGQQHIAPLLDSFQQRHPGVSVYLHLEDSLVNIVRDGFDLGIRYGLPGDSRLISRRLARSYRVLCAAPAYLAAQGTPRHPDDLRQHRCLVMVRSAEPLTTWHFNSPGGPVSVPITPARMTSNGALVRRWALEGAGIAMKSYWDVAADLAAGRLVTVLDDCALDFEKKGVDGGADIQLLYPSRDYLPQRSRRFMDELVHYFAALQKGQ